jgi:hypothetical protein
MFHRNGNLDSAYYYYTLALDGTLPDSMRANALYTTASIARRMGDSVLARDYEDRLIARLPDTRYARSIMVARGMPLPVDTAAVARGAYERAFAPIERGDIPGGIRALEQMAASYPHSEQAVRAKLAIAMAYEDSNQGQKALDVYTRMVQDHPTSPYSKRGKDILDAIEREKNRPAEEEKKKKEEELRLAREAEEAERRKAEEEQRKRPPRLLDEELKAEREAAREREKKQDPTKDSDFPLNLPGEYKPKQPDQPKHTPGATQKDSTRTQNPQPVTPQPAPAPKKNP